MKKRIFIGLSMLSLLGCDPVSDMEANIENLTPQALRVEVVSSIQELGKTIEIAPNKIERFQEGFDIGSTYLEPNFNNIDSIVIKNPTGEVLKVYKENNSGRNIYDIENWDASEPSKRFFKYKFEIRQEDLD